ncbi:MAG: Stp1/IreP family PP2C-type Ser/Thr phosphatase [Oscillospiraceae bacterium]|nr:Stp1/IreP family PP2C-type Ser/Thr phosphatase [Oscillospiraceae bacterium]
MKVVGKTDIGMSRNINQDYFSYGYLRDDSAFAVVCDGMGGQTSGDIASHTVCKIVSDKIKENFKSKMSPDEIKKILIDSIQEANNKVYQLSILEKNLRGMGTTIVAVISVKNVAYISHVGDSRLYILASKKLYQITKDHSFVQRLLELGKISKADVNSHPHKNIITRAVGISYNINIDFNINKIDNQDKIILCTDGLTNYCDINIMENILNNYTGESACNKLVDIANDLGGKDNITVVILSND